MKQQDITKLCFLPGALLPLSDGKYNYINLLKQGLTNLGVTFPSSGGGSVQSVTGNIVDNTDPLNPVVTQTAPSLKATQIAFGDVSGLMTSSSDLTWNTSTKNYSSNIAAFNLYGTSNYPDGIFSVDDASEEVRIGDWNEGATGTKFVVEMAAGIARFDNIAHTGLFGINTPTPSVALDVIGDVNLGSLQDFTDNAAAITGGLSVGNLYYTSSGGDGLLKIVI